MASEAIGAITVVVAETATAISISGRPVNRLDKAVKETLEER